VYDLTGLKGYDGTERRITTVNMNSDKVKEYNYQLFRHWADPNGDGHFDDGVDGFRLDHMMDNLDNKNKWTHLFNNFWVPLINRLKEVNPRLTFVAEQADWASLGLDYLEKGGVDRVFAFRVAFEIRNLNKTKLGMMADSVFHQTPKGKQQVVFIENHDMPRFATVVKQDKGKLRVGAALNLLLGGIPSIYYGQELGMVGAGAPMKWGMTDANEIPEREAFEWYKNDSGKGMAIWYKNSGPWWDSTNLKPNDGISLEEERDDTTSLWNFYRKLIRLRKSHAALSSGSYQTLNNTSDSVFSFLRYLNKSAVLVVVNLSGLPQQTTIDFSNSKAALSGTLQPLWGRENPIIGANNISVQLPEYGIEVWEFK
jgi:glycosidase